MGNLPSWVTKVTSTWVAIGALLIVLSTQGVSVPDQLLSIFSQEFVDAFLAMLGSVITFLQYVRLKLHIDDSKTRIEVLSNKRKIGFIINPFKIRA